ncbi:MAG TPA: hypothetical protein VHA15_14150 [Burkholderiales bacterium]|nr:hypothetical protein [Burkholderiales bacterium]
MNIRELAWDTGLMLASKGDVTQLADLLRDEDYNHVPLSVRKALALMVEGHPLWKTKRGIKTRLTYGNQIMIRSAVRHAKITADLATFDSIKAVAPKLSKKKIDEILKEIKKAPATLIKVLAEEHNVSESTIRDVVSERKTFAEK